MAQLFAMTAELNRNMLRMAQTMREEMQCMGAGLQDGLDKVKGGQDQLKGEIGKNMTAVEEFKIGQGELRRATCWGRPAKETETTECTETREIGERLHGVEEEEDAPAHTHIEIARDNGESSPSVWGPGASSRVSSLGNQGRVYAPLKPVTTRRIRSCRAR